MAALYFEDTECKMWEKVEPGESKSFVKNDVYTSIKTEKITFNSTIFSYGDVSTLVNREKRFSEFYYAVVIFSDELAKAWNLIQVPAKLNIKVKRMTKNLFLVIGEAEKEGDVSQISFCKLKPSTKVDEITINFTKLLKIDFLENQHILINIEERLDKGMSNVPKSINTLALYAPDGTLVKNIFEYYSTDDYSFNYILLDDALMVYKIDENKNENLIVHKLKDLIPTTPNENSLI